MQKLDLLKAEEKTEEETGTSLFHHLMAQRKKLVEDPKIVLQQLIVIAQLPRDVADRTELGVHFENLNFQLSKQHIWDHITGLLLIYPSCLLQIIESSRDILISVLKDIKAMQQQPDSSLLEAKVVFMAHNPHKRLFQQWSYKVLDVDPEAEDAEIEINEEDEDSAETLVCSVLSALQKLSIHMETSENALLASVLDEYPELIIPQKTVEQLLDQDELQTPQQYLQMYDSPLNISMEFGKIDPRKFSTA